MDNNNNQNVEMVSIPVEDESTTQVLNINEVEELAKMERKASRRPGMMFLFAGILAIALGVSFPYIMSAIGDDSYLNNGEVPEEVISDGEIEEDVLVKELICSKEKVDDINQITYLENITFNFNTNGLTGYVKTLKTTPVDVTNAVYVAELTGYLGLAVDTTGYNLTVLDNTVSYDASLAVDLLSYDIATLGDNYKMLPFTNIVYSVNQTIDEVTILAETELYVCQ